MTDALITPEELADLEARTPRVSEAGLVLIENHLGRMHDAGAARIEAGVVRGLISDLRAARATIRAVTARAEAAEKRADGVPLDTVAAIVNAAGGSVSVLPHHVAQPVVLTTFDDAQFGGKVYVTAPLRAARLLPAEPDHG